MAQTFADVLFLLLIIFIVVVAPIAFIASLNTLFDLGIGYTFKTWAGALFLVLLLGSGASK